MSVCLRYCVMHWLYWVLCLGLSSESIHPRHCIVPAHWEERWWHLTATTPSTPFILEYCLLWQKEAKCMTQNLFPKKNLLLIMARSENCWFKVRKGKWEGYFNFFSKCPQPQHGLAGNLLPASILSHHLFTRGRHHGDAGSGCFPGVQIWPFARDLTQKAGGSSWKRKKRHWNPLQKTFTAQRIVLHFLHGIDLQLLIWKWKCLETDSSYCIDCISLFKT